MHLPMHLASRCGARTRRANSCRAPAMSNGRCRLHGGKSTGAPKGNKNARKHVHTWERPLQMNDDAAGRAAWLALPWRMVRCVP